MQSHELGLTLEAYLDLVLRNAATNQEIIVALSKCEWEKTFSGNIRRPSMNLRKSGIHEHTTCAY